MKSDKFFTFKNDNIFSFCSLNQNFALSLQTNNINLVNNVAGVSASDDDLHAYFMVQGEWLMVNGMKRQ